MPSPSPAPGPRSRIPGRLAVQLFGRQLDFLADAKARWGDVVGWRVGPQRVALLSHPDDIRDLLVTNQRHFAKGRGLQRAKLLLGEGLLTSEGAYHLRQRRLAQPAFHRERVAGYAATMVALAERRAAGWTAGARVDVHAEMLRLTLAIAARTLFDADVEGEAADIGAALETAVESFALAVVPLSEWIDHLPFGPGRRFQVARRRLDATIHRIIAERRADPRDRGDLLSMLMAARDEDGGPGMSDAQLRDEMMTILLAGHETTANLLAWALALLAREPAIQARVHAELDAVLGDRPPLPADVPRLGYVRQVVAETLRLYPPAWVLGRRALQPFEVRGHHVHAETLVLASEWLVHRDPRWWPDPTRFDPDRWAGDGPTGLPRFAYFPFGGGTRVCIGEQFAWTEAILVLASLLRRWRLHADGPLPPHRALITLRPAGAVEVALASRAAARGADRGLTRVR